MEFTVWYVEYALIEFDDYHMLTVLSKHHLTATLRNGIIRLGMVVMGFGHCSHFSCTACLSIDRLILSKECVCV